MTLARACSQGGLSPRPEHLAVVAEQQQEHARAREQDAGEGLDDFVDHAERRAGDQHDRGRRDDQSGEQPVEALRVARSCGAASSWSPNTSPNA